MPLSINIIPTVLICYASHNRILRTGGYKKRTLFSHSSRGWMSKIKVPASPQLLQRLLSLCVFTWSVYTLLESPFLSTRAQVLLDKDCTFWTSFNLHYSLKGPMFEGSHIRSQGFNMDQRGKILSVIPTYSSLFKNISNSYIQTCLYIYIYIQPTLF